MASSAADRPRVMGKAERMALFDYFEFQPRNGVTASQGASVAQAEGVSMESGGVEGAEGGKEFSVGRNDTGSTVSLDPPEVVTSADRPEKSGGQEGVIVDVEVRWWRGFLCSPRRCLPAFLAMSGVIRLVLLARGIRQTGSLVVLYGSLSRAGALRTFSYTCLVLVTFVRRVAVRTGDCDTAVLYFVFSDTCPDVTISWNSSKNMISVQDLGESH